VYAPNYEINKARFRGSGIVSQPAFLTDFLLRRRHAAR